MADINVTPLVDVMLVLLVIFMVTAPLLIAGVPVELPKPPGLSVTEDSLGKVEFSAISNGEVVRFEGRLQNLSPLRPMVFHVLVLTDGGTYADWFVDALDSSKAAALPAQVAIKPIANARVTGGGSAFRVKIRSTTPDSATAQAWRSGQLPTPLLETRRPRDNDD